MSIETTGSDYTAENIKTLKDAAHIRQNPGMYVGNTHLAGLHHRPVGREPLVAALAAGDAATARREIAAAIASFQDFATDALFSLSSSLDVAGSVRRQRQTRPTARAARPDRPSQQGDIT